MPYRELDDSPIPSFAIDATGTIRYANARAEAQMRATGVVGTSLWALFPDAEASPFGDAMRRALHGRTVATARADYLPLGSSFAIVATPVGDEALVQVVDVGAIDRTRSALADTTHRLARAEEIARLGNWSWEIDTGHVEWSDGLYALLGRERGFLPARARLDDVLHPDDHALNEAAIDQALRTGEPYRLRLRLRAGDGTWRRVDARGEVIRDDAGRPIRMFGTVQDVTAVHEVDEALRRLETQMLHAQKLESLGVLAGGIAHEFNNLLVGMLGNASLALLDTPAESPARSALADIEHAAQRAAELTRQLLAFSGRGRFVVEPIDLSRLVEEMTALLRATLTKKAELTLALPPGLPAIEGDATQLRQVIMNLLSNASDAIGDESGTIAIRTGVQEVDARYRTALVNGDAIGDGPHVYVDVADTGHGMESAVVQRVFDPFYSTKFTGRGLGLAATLGIVRGHGGAIRVYSERGRGSTFRLLFPTSAATAVRDQPAAADADARIDATVLVVDDESAVRTVAKALLERRGCRVLLAEDGEQGVAVFARDPAAIDLVLLDLTMPRLDGEQAFRALRGIDPDVRVVLMSGYNQQDVTAHFVGKGLAGFVQKPFRASELHDSVARALARDRRA